ncbi:MAG: DUF3617 domain-containing protein [Rhizomicrobium sp.]
MRLSFAIAASVVFAASTVPASASDFPTRRAGLWETTMHLDQGGMGAMNTKMCLDANTDARMMKYGMSHQSSDCAPPNIQGMGSVRTVDVVCHMGGSTQKSHITIAYTGNASYHMDMQTVFDPPFHGQSKNHMSQDAKWMGACPAGMKPGDMQMPGGYTMNIMNAMNHPAGAGGNPYGHLTQEQIQAIMKAHGGH